MVSDAEDALRTHLAYGHEILAVPNTKHEGSLALTESMLNLEGNGAYLSALYSNKDGSVTARIFNRLTQENNISLHFSRKISEASQTDLTGNKQKSLSPQGTCLTLSLAPATITTLQIRPKT